MVEVFTSKAFFFPPPFRGFFPCWVFPVALENGAFSTAQICSSSFSFVRFLDWPRCTCMCVRTCMLYHNNYELYTITL